MAEAAPTTETEEPRDASSILYPQRDPEVQAEPESEAPEIIAESTVDSAEGIEAPKETPEGEEHAEGDAEEVISSLSQLIEHEEWDPEWVDNLKVPVKVNGVQSEATMKDLVASYQMKEASVQRLEDAKAKAHTIAQEAEQEREKAKTSLVEAAGLITLAERMFSLEAAEANLAGLRESDPVAYLAAKDGLSERRKAIDAVKAEAAKAFQQAQMAMSNDEPDQEMLREEQTKLRASVPDWSDDERWKADSADIFQYLVGDGYGFTAEQVGSAIDHRLFLLARKAMLYDRQQASVQTARKKVLTIPKVMKPGGGQQENKSAPKDHASVLYGTQT